MSLIGLSELCSIRMKPGMAQISYIPKSWVNHLTSFVLRDDGGKMLGSIYPNPSRSFLNMPAMLDSKAYSASDEVTEHGALTTHRIKGFYPGCSDAIIAEMNKMSRLAMLVWIKSNDRNLNIMLGDLSSGCQFTYSYDSGLIPGEREGVDFEFAWTTGQGVTFQIPA